MKAKLKNEKDSSWKKKNNYLVKEFLFRDFKTAIQFINKIAIVSEEMNHHPDWSNSFNRVEIKLQTKDLHGVITEKDFLLAEKIDTIFFSLR